MNIVCDVENIYFWMCPRYTKEKKKKNSEITLKELHISRKYIYCMLRLPLWHTYIYPYIYIYTHYTQHRYTKERHMNAYPSDQWPKKRTTQKYENTLSIRVNNSLGWYCHLFMPLHP